jgi:presequence protease
VIWPRSGQLASCSAEDYQWLQKEELFGLTRLGLHSAPSWQRTPAPATVSPQGRIIASPVAFTCVAVPTVSYTDPTAPAVDLTSRLLTNLCLHRRIREQGGAYGGGATGATHVGRFQFYAYRDPQLSQTLDAFRESLDLVVDGRFEPGELEEAKLQLLQKLDTPQPPAGRATTAYNWQRTGATLERRQAYRDRLFAITADQIRAVAAELREQFPQAPVICFGGKQLLEKENQQLAAQGAPLLTIDSV